MKSINIIFAIIFSVSCLPSYGQFKPKTEFEYLQLINRQQSKILIKDNAKNTEMVISRLIDLENNAYSPFFFNELAISNKIIDQNELSFYYILLQRCLFPNDSLSTFQKNAFFENAYSINLSRNSALSYWKGTLKPNLPEKYTDRIILLLKLSIQLHSDKLTNHIYSLGLALRKKETAIPAWYQHWEFLTIIGFNEKKKKEILTIETYPYKPIYEQIDGSKKTNVYRKAIKHYIKSDAKVYAKELIVDYQALDLSMLDKIDLMMKKIKVKLK